MRRASVLAWVVLIAAGAAHWALAADPMRVPTFVSAGPGEHSVSGSVSSPARSCERRRIVTAYRERDGVVTKLGRDRTNRKGEWSVAAETGPGTYWATSPRRRVESRGNVLICKKGRSPKVMLLGSDDY